jgi:hemerythrin-like domain-containing protein
MDAIKFLKDQHQNVRELFSLFEKARESTDQDMICQQLADNLAAHMAIEEEIFYPAVFSAMNDESGLQEAMAEHQEAKDILAEILDMDMSLGEQRFEEQMRLLQQAIERHVQEEEDEVFKQTREVLGSDELDRLGMQMKALWAEQMSGEPSESLLEQAEDSADEQSDDSSARSSAE